MFFWLELFSCCCNKNARSFPVGSAKGHGSKVTISPRSRRSSKRVVARIDVVVIGFLDSTRQRRMDAVAFGRVEMVADALREHRRLGQRQRQHETSDALIDAVEANLAPLLPRKAPGNRQSQATATTRGTAREERVEQMLTDRRRRT